MDIIEEINNPDLNFLKTDILEAFLYNNVSKKEFIKEEIAPKIYKELENKISSLIETDRF